MGDVVRDGEDGDEHQVGQEGGAIESPETANAAEHEEGHEADLEDVADLVGLLVKLLGGDAPEAGPVIEDAADGLVDHELRMGADVVDGERVFFLEEAGFTEGEPLPHFSGNAGGVGEAGIKRGVAAVVVVKLEPEIVADGAENAEGAVVANGPWG